MTLSHRLSAFIAVLFFSVLFLTGCAQSKMDPFGMSFMPPVPRQAVAAAVSVAEPPKVIPNIYLKETPPTFVTPAIVHPPSFSQTIRRAEGHFQEGKRLYQEGKVDAARVEFDKALDILLEAPETTDRAALEKKFDELVRSIYRYDIDGLGSGESSQEPVFETSPLEAILELTFPVDPKIRNKVGDEVRLTASQLPLQMNDAVLSYINYFSSERGRRVIVGGLKRSGRYKALISGILEEEGVPQELIHLAQAESGFIPRAISRKAATGMWQFIRFRGQEYGLKQTSFFDDRLDPEKATRAAARHLRDLYDQFGDWYLALAAYNCGPGCVDRAVQRTGYADFWELRSRNVLPKETQNYVPAILAMTIIAKNASDYGLEDVELDPPYEYENISIAAPTNLALVADAADKPVSEIREMNPALLKPIAPAGYELHVPKGTASPVLAALESVPASRRATWRVHRVETGETLSAIAKRYKTPLAAIEAANTAMLDDPATGDLLVIPASYQAKKVVTPKRRVNARATGRSSAARSRRAAGKTAASKTTPSFRHERALASAK